MAAPLTQLRLSPSYFSLPKSPSTGQPLAIDESEDVTAIVFWLDHAQVR
jgi:hypothetical protein